MKISSDGRLAFWPEPEARRNFEHQLGSGLRREWDSLSGESDPEILAAAALRIAARLESSDQPEKAAYLLSGLSQSSDLPPRLKGKAESRWAALQGGGSFGQRVESLFGHLLRETRRPWPMLAMAGAGTCFQISRLALLARLRGPATTLALPLATVGEAAAFTLTIPALEKLAPHPGGTTWRGFGSEFLSSLLLMSSLKLSAWPLRFASPSLHFPSIYGGVLLAQSAERHWGLRPEASASAALADGLAMALQIQAGAGIARLALGSGGTRFLAEAEMRSRGLRRVTLSASEYPNDGHKGPPTALGGMRSFALLRMTPQLPRPNSKFLPDIYAMSQSDSDRPRPPLRLVSSDPYEEFVQTYAASRPFQEAYQRILSHYGPRHEGNKLSALLLNSGILHPGVMTPGLGKLAEVLCGNPGEAALSYRHWLAQRIYERVYFENRSPRALGETIRSLALDESSANLEQRLAEHFPELDLRTPRPPATPVNSLQFEMEAAKRQHDWREFKRATSILPLDDRARTVVFDWKRAQAENYLGNMQASIDRFLDDFYELGQGPQTIRVLDVNAAIGAAGDSPLGVARLARLEALIRTGGGNPSLERLTELH